MNEWQRLISCDHISIEGAYSDSTGRRMIMVRFEHPGQPNDGKQEAVDELTRFVGHLREPS
jgi:hypothetical protein